MDARRLDRTEADLRRWLVGQARAGIPEVVLVAVLRKNADAIDDLGYLPRSWIDRG